MPEREPRDAALGRRQAARPDPQAIEARCGEFADRPPRAGCEQPPLPFRWRESSRLGLHRTVGKCQRCGGLCHTQIPLDVVGGEREHRPDPFESVPPRILVEQAGLPDVEVHAEQVVDRMAVFLAAEAREAHRSPPAHARGLPGLEPTADPLDRVADLRPRRPRLLLGRHLAGRDPRPHLGPPFGHRHVAEVMGQRIETEAPLLRARVVAPQTVPGKKRLRRVVGLRRGSGRAGEGQHQASGNRGRVGEGFQRIFPRPIFHGRTIRCDFSRSSLESSRSSGGIVTNFQPSAFTRTIRPGR